MDWYGTGLAGNVPLEEGLCFEPFSLSRSFSLLSPPSLEGSGRESCSLRLLSAAGMWEAEWEVGWGRGEGRRRGRKRAEGTRTTTVGSRLGRRRQAQARRDCPQKATAAGR